MSAVSIDNDWCGILRQHGVIAVAKAFGMSFVLDGRPTMGMTPCPGCGAEKRHPSRKDKRGAVGLRSDCLGWECFECGIKGDPVTLASYLAGERGQVSSATRRACESVGLLQARINHGQPKATYAPRPIQHRTEAAAPAKPKRPPPDELRTLTRQLCTIDSDPDPDVREWLLSRGFEPDDIAKRGVAMTLPKNATVPAWATFGGASWGQRGYRLLVPLRDANGETQSIHARRITSADPKSTNPTGFEIRGLLIACPVAVALLRGEADAIKYAQEHGVVIVEGVPDWLSWQVAQQAVVFGVVAGSWGPDFAEKIPDGCTVCIATHNDEQGDKYATKIKETFHARLSAGTVRLLRRRY